VDVQSKLDEIVALVEGARSMPMSASCVLNRSEVLAHLDELAGLLPAELSEARNVLSDRAGVVDQGRAEASRLVDEARDERARMVERAAVAQEAQRAASRIVAAAREEAEQMRGEIDDYVDVKLANFEVVLNKTLAAVGRGRSKLHQGFSPAADESDGSSGEPPA
jgi:hypothetical protein